MFKLQYEKLTRNIIFSSLVPSFLKYKKPSTNDDSTILINSNDKLTLHLINNINYYKLIKKDVTDNQ